jgi:DNA-binding CsgD family transcriptional regulator
MDPRDTDRPEPRITQMGDFPARPMCSIGGGGAETTISNEGRAMPRKVTRGPSPSTGTFSDLGRLILDRIDRAVFALRRDGRIADANAEARALLRANHGLTLRDGRLRFADSRLDAEVGALLRKQGAGLDVGQGLARRMRASNSSEAYSVLITPVPAEFRDDRSAVLVFIYAPAANRSIAPALLEQLYGLTRAQALVAARLFERVTIEATAAELGLSEHTVRSHLKRVFETCGVHSKSELLQLLAMGPREF